MVESARSQTERLGQQEGSVRIAVFGAGGVGGYFGGRLGLAGAEVHLIARGTHLKALQEKGLTVKSTRGDFHIDLPATADPGSIGPCDFVLFCVKSTDTAAAARHLGPLLHDDTAVISLQNGIENEDVIASAVGGRHVVGGAAYIFSTILQPGTIEHSGGPARIVFGELDGRSSERTERFLAMSKQAGIDASMSEDIRRVLWDKFAFICAQAGITAAVRLPIGDIRTVEESRATFERVVAEVCAIARAEGVDLGSDAPERHAAFADQLEPGSFSSLHYDMTHGKPMELETLHGAVVRLARKHSVPAPTSETIYAILKPWAVRNLGG
jgi:2-dehydropantoate 2-reductase